MERRDQIHTGVGTTVVDDLRYDLERPLVRLVGTYAAHIIYLHTPNSEYSTALLI